MDPLVGASMSYRSSVASGDASERRLAFDAIDRTHPIADSLVDADESRATVTVWLREGDADAVRHVLDVTDEQLEAQPFNPGIAVSWSGEGVETIDWQQEAVRDPARWMLAAVLAGIVAIFIGLRSLRWAVTALAPAAVAYLAVFGFLGWVDGVHGVPSAIGGVLLVVFAVEAGIVATLHYRHASSRTWSAREAAAELGSGPGRGIVVAAVATTVAMAPLATSDLLPNGRSGSLLLIGAGVGGAWALVMVCAVASGPPRNTAPLEVKGASPP